MPPALDTKKDTFEIELSPLSGFWFALQTQPSAVADGKGAVAAIAAERLLRRRTMTILRRLLLTIGPLNANRFLQ